MSHYQIKLFQETVWEYYRAHARTMPWRDDPSPYKVLVSEIMLQQTQVERVIPKFYEFLRYFPGTKALASASLAKVLTVWSGLGYNRRAKFLHQTAQIIATRSARLPVTLEELIQLPGIGKNTAGAILAYAYNQPVVFIETNIRSVYFHHFFIDREEVSDAELSPIIAGTLDHESPREWYWALMDYGAYLKQMKTGSISKSKHYKKQSTFAGSRRQIRGGIIHDLLAGPATLGHLNSLFNDERTESVIAELEKENFVQIKNQIVQLTDKAALP